MRISDWSSDVCSSDLLDQFALGRKGEHLALEHRKPRVLQQFLGAGRMVEDFEQVLQPRIILALGVRTLLVSPMSGKALFGLFVHLARADLDLDRKSVV